MGAIINDVNFPTIFENLHKLAEHMTNCKNVEIGPNCSILTVVWLKWLALDHDNLKLMALEKDQPKLMVLDHYLSKSMALDPEHHH